MDLRHGYRRQTSVNPCSGRDSLGKPLMFRQISATTL